MKLQGSEFNSEAELGQRNEGQAALINNASGSPLDKP
jgi:hypothetical protein